MHLPLAPGDEVIFFSDGIVDAVNARGEQYGAEALCGLVQQMPDCKGGAQQAVDTILDAVSAHQSGTEHFDDETVLVLRVRC